MLLSILIATTNERKEMFDLLMEEFRHQIIKGRYLNEVEVIFECDNKEISIGAKRQKLLERSSGKWIVFFDDDDKPFPYYVSFIMQAIKSEIYFDCIGINVFMTTDGRRPQKCCHSIEYPDWKDNVDGWDFVRNVTHFNPVLREKAIQIGFKDIRFGEDKEYADRLFPLLKSEYYITKPLFHYRYTTTQKHAEKYGL